MKLYLLPMGSHEQHGRHLPATVDAEIASAVASAAARLLPAALRAEVLPCLSYGVSNEHAWSETTVSTTTIALAELIESLRISVSRHHDPSALLLVNGHGGNRTACDLVVERAPGDTVRAAHVGALLAKTGLSPVDIHGGVGETSLMMAVRPGLDLELAAEELANRKKLRAQSVLDRAFSRSWTSDPAYNVSSLAGAVSDPGSPSRELGKSLLDEISARIQTHVQGWLLHDKTQCG